MKIVMYKTKGGKNVIGVFPSKLPDSEEAEGWAIIKALKNLGYDALRILNTRQIYQDLWEIKFRRHNRFFYIILKDDTIYILHACKKQKGKAEKKDIYRAMNRKKEIGEKQYAISRN